MRIWTRHALKICTGPDGKLYCMPTAIRHPWSYVWKDAWPNGFPTTPDQILKEAERLQEEGKYAMTLFGNTGFGGDGAAAASTRSCPPSAAATMMARARCC